MNTQTIQIYGTGSEMQGVGRHTDGRAVFVAGALPGELVEVAIRKEAPRYCEAQLLKLLKPSPMRSASACPYYGRCGGCAARHMQYEYALSLKRQRVFDALCRIGGLVNPDVRPAIAAPERERCRNKAEYALEYKDSRLQIGLRPAGSHDIIEIKDCLLQKAQSIRALSWAQERLPDLACARHIKYIVTRVNRKDEMCIVFSCDAPVAEALKRMVAEMRSALPEMHSLFLCKLNPRPIHALDGKCSLLWGEETLTDELLSLPFELSPQSFFQVNPIQAEHLYSCALDAIGAERGMCLLDAYCGAGTISLAAAQRGCRVLGVEIVAPAIENARRNAQINRLEQTSPKAFGKPTAPAGASFICADAASEIPRLIQSGIRFDAAILDPPRKGADPALLHALADSNIPKLAYVSCNPSTLARDVKLLCTRGYRLVFAQPVDMFPWTEHVETVVLLSKFRADKHI